MINFNPNTIERKEQSVDTNNVRRLNHPYQPHPLNNNLTFLHNDSMFINQNGNKHKKTTINHNNNALLSSSQPSLPSQQQSQQIQNQTQSSSLNKINANNNNNNNDDNKQDLVDEQIGCEPKSICTNDPCVPIVSLKKYKREFKTVSQAALRFQFICESYRKCKLGSVKEKDFNKLEDVVNFVYDQVLKRKNRNNINNNSLTTLSPLLNSNNSKQQYLRPSLSIINNPICSICNKQFSSSNCYTTCNHPLCIKCIVNTFNHPPRSPKWYLCPVSTCLVMLPPETHFYMLSYKPSMPSISQQQQPLTSNNNNNKSLSDLYTKMYSEYKLLRNIGYKNMLKILGEYFSFKFKNYCRWRKCFNCDFGFLADPDVNWYQVFELKCVVCNIIQRVQLLAPSPCNKLILKLNYYPNDLISKTLIFIRHAQAQNNINANNLLINKIIDPGLTNKGKQQSAHLNKYFGCLINIDCILSSSMNRAIQTGCIAFNNQLLGSGCNKNIKFILLESLRERLSPYFNRRENISIKKEKYKKYNMINYDECLLDNDIYFDSEKKNEKYQDMNKRAWQFYNYLIKRNEKCIAIVSHEGMLQCLLNIIQTNDKSLTKTFKNAEARLCYLTQTK